MDDVSGYVDVLDPSVRDFTFAFVEHARVNVKGGFSEVVFESIVVRDFIGGDGEEGKDDRNQDERGTDGLLSDPSANEEREDDDASGALEGTIGN